MEPQKYLIGRYFQKSLNYLYPLIGVDKDALFKPSCYLWWGQDVSIDDNRILVLYQETDSVLYEPFEKNEMFSNPYFEVCYRLEGGSNAYVFDLSSYKDTVAKFKRGNYSQFAEGIKKRILVFHGASTDKIPRPGRHIHTSLYPELYYDLVAEEIGVTGLEEVGELTDAPNELKETTTLKIVEKCSSFTKKLLPSGK